MQFDVSSELCRLQPTMLYGAKLLFLNKAPVLKSGSIIVFDAVSPDDIFQEVLDAFYGG